MASSKDFEIDWLALREDCSEWTESDLQLAAELGKTLLERNKELETALKQQQNVVEDQAQEIEYLTKQTVALREVNDSRLRIYEQLEVSIQDLERANHRLVLENSTEKRHIKSLTTTIEGLECKIEELQTLIDDLRLQNDLLKRKAQQQIKSPTIDTRTEIVTLRHVGKYEHDETDGPSAATSPDSSSTTHIDNSPNKATTTTQQQQQQQIEKTEKEKQETEADSGLEQMSQLLAQLRETKAQASRDQRRVTELEEQLATVLQQNQALENQVIQLHHRDEDLKSMHEELNTLEEVRQGQMCSRCLRSMDKSSADEEVPEDDDLSMLNALQTPPQFRSSFTLDVQDNPTQPSPATPKSTGNLYKDLVDKYEALLEVHRKPSNRSQKRNENSVSLQEELQMSGDFTINTKDTDEESGHGDSLKPEKPKRLAFSTPTDFSEAETSSSGFSDETSNKCTQTDERHSGSFFYAVADGDDYKLSIYNNDASQITNRFQNRPEYQQLFKEIFMVLKSAAENKNDEIITPVKSIAPSFVPTTPPILEVDDDSQSVLSSTMSELSMSQNEPTTVIENIIQSQNQPIPEPEQQEDSSSSKSEYVLRPLVRQPLEYISVEVRKRSGSKRRKHQQDRSNSPAVTQIIGSPKINYSSRPCSGRKKREAKANAHDTNDGTGWNGNTLQFWSTNRSNVASPTPSQGSGRFEFKPSLASQDLHKLKKLDLSYAEVLRKADTKKAMKQYQRRSK